MSKNYVVNCYTCQHNGQETCKGCRTLLVGEDEPYENWQLREDLEIKDKTIADLEAKLAKNKKWLASNEGFLENQKLKQQLAEKEREIEKSHLILDKILTEIHTNCYSGLNIVHFKEMALNDLGGLEITHNQDKISFAVEQLEKVKEYIKTNLMSFQKVPIIQEIDNQIKQLKEMK